MEDLKHQLLLLEEEAHPDLQRGLARLESQRTERKMLNATLFSIVRKKLRGRSLLLERGLIVSFRRRRLPTDSFKQSWRLRAKTSTTKKSLCGNS